MPRTLRHKPSRNNTHRVYSRFAFESSIRSLPVFATLVSFSKLSNSPHPDNSSHLDISRLCAEGSESCQPINMGSKEECGFTTWWPRCQESGLGSSTANVKHIYRHIDLFVLRCSDVCVATLLMFLQYTQRVARSVTYSHAVEALFVCTSRFGAAPESAVIMGDTAIM
jgi:hypothetical protein